jgi:DNA-binding MarR family transcriptional regulator
MAAKHHGEIEHRYREMMARTFGQTDMCAMDLFRNLMKTSHILTALTDRNLSKYNLTIAKLRLLFWLKLRSDEGEGMLASELSRFQGIMPNTVSSLLTSLRRAGLIEQVSHISDRRKRVIRITATGIDLLEEIGPEHHAFMRTLFQSLTDEEIKTMNLLMNKLIVALKTASNYDSENR